MRPELSSDAESRARTGRPIHIYIAGRVTARKRLKLQREALQARGHFIEASWLDIAEQYPAALSQPGEAVRDLNEIVVSKLLLIDTLDESPTGGREFECGYAYGHNIPFWVIGPMRNIFHNLAERRFDTWPDAMIQL